MNNFHFSDSGKSIIQRLCALVLTIVALQTQVLIWNYVGMVDSSEFIVGKTLGFDNYSLLPALILTGFASLWILLLIQKSASKNAMIFMLIVLGLTALFNVILAYKGTSDSWELLFLVNNFVFTVNGLFGVIYAFFHHES